ncbi:2654_t:CDS:2 [Cetraspora pellucida]|uniref:2654_t:CDS:1 n=1 Tax=Cetraspora pellucida TaxID=1433469 RepID=A0A9N9A0S8_9GLOM|nr:2654_t:CDS:2 [Cetraspora pellucida]
MVENEEQENKMINYFSDKFTLHNSQEIGEQNSLAIKESSERILKRLESISGKSQAGIMYGKIQSGKTKNFLALISFSFDKGYAICILLNSSIVSIANQNKERVEDCFKEEKEKVKILVVEKNKNQLENENGEALQRKWVGKGKKIIIVIPKHHSWLEKVIQFITKNKILFSNKVLIVDDEGDQASLNNNATRTNQEATKTNDLINRMRNELPHHSYVFVTATPFANIIVDNRNERTHEKMIRIIPDIEAKKLLSSKDTSLSSSLKKALATFLVGATLLELRKGDGPGYEMIINPHYGLEEQKNIFGKVQKFVEELKSSFEKSDGYFESFVRDGLQEISADVVHSVNDADLVNSVKHTVNECMVTTLNSEGNSKESEQTTANNIYIGAKSIEEKPLAKWIVEGGGFVLDSTTQRLTRSGVGKTYQEEPKEQYLPYSPQENIKIEEEFYQKLAAEENSIFVKSKVIYSDKNYQAKEFENLQKLFEEFFGPELSSHIFFKKIGVKREIFQQIVEASVASSTKTKLVLVDLEEKPKKRTLTDGKLKNFFGGTEEKEDNKRFRPINKDEIMLQV